MPKSVLEAVKQGYWDFEPPTVDPDDFDPSDAMPGSQEKLDVLVERMASGLPLWHDSDRLDAEAPSRPRHPR